METALPEWTSPAPGDVDAFRSETLECANDLPKGDRFTSCHRQNDVNVVRHDHITVYRDRPVSLNDNTQRLGRGLTCSREMNGAAFHDAQHVCTGPNNGGHKVRSVARVYPARQSQTGISRPSQEQSRHAARWRSRVIATSNVALRDEAQVDKGAPFPETARRHVGAAFRPPTIHAPTAELPGQRRRRFPDSRTIRSR